MSYERSSGTCQPTLKQIPLNHRDGNWWRWLRVRFEGVFEEFKSFGLESRILGMLQDSQFSWLNNISQIINIDSKCNFAAMSEPCKYLKVSEFIKNFRSYSFLLSSKFFFCFFLKHFTHQHRLLLLLLPFQLVSICFDNQKVDSIRVLYLLHPSQWLQTLSERVEILLSTICKYLIFSSMSRRRKLIKSYFALVM